MSSRFDPRNVRHLAARLLAVGLTPEKIALTIALGVVIGVVPVLGSTTILCAAVALPLGLNLPLIQTVNYLVYPLQIALLLPFIRAGEWLFGGPELAMSVGEVMTLAGTSPAGAISILWAATLQALVAWMLVATATGTVLYFGMIPVVSRWMPAREVRR